MGGVIAPVLSVVGGLLGQNMANKSNASAAQSAQNNAAAQTSLHQQQAMQGLQRFLAQNPNPASTWGGLNVPASIGGGVTTGGVNPLQQGGGPPQGGFNPMIAQILQGLLSGQGGAPSAVGGPSGVMGTNPGQPMTNPLQMGGGPQQSFGPRPAPQVPSAIVRMGNPGSRFQ